MCGTGWTMVPYRDIPPAVAVVIRRREGGWGLEEELPGLLAEAGFDTAHVARRFVAAGGFRTSIAIDPFNRRVLVESNPERIRGTATWAEWLAIALYVERRA